MTTIGTLFSGFGGADIGAQAAGLELAWGVEFDADIAAVAHANLPHDIRVANLLDCDPRTFDRVDVLHASPPCPNFSIAKAGGVETALDIALADKVAEFVTVLQPRVFTLENVWAYRGSRSWAIIQDALHGAGYWVNTEHVNSADMGVPQARKRMIVRAIKGGFVPYMPEPVPWVGWYAAIEDLLPALPESAFAPWQINKLPIGANTLLVDGGNSSKDCIWRRADEPSLTVTTGGAKHPLRAFLLPGQDFTQSRQATGPSYTISATELKHASRALLATGRVVSMTPRCLARFQSFPDWYELPDNNRLAAKGIGNAVPPLMMQRIYEGLEAML